MTDLHNFDDDDRPNLSRQRSNSAPTFPIIDCTADEAVIICSAAAKASDRRRGRRKGRKYASLDPETSRSTSRHDGALEDVAEEKESPMSDSGLLARRQKILSLESYSTNMAGFIRERIEQIRRPSIENSVSSPRSPSPPVMSLPDDMLAASPPPEEEDNANTTSVLETIRHNAVYLRPEDYPQFRPPPQSQFSAWSSATTMDMNADRMDSPVSDMGDGETARPARPMSYFNFPAAPSSSDSTVQEISPPEPSEPVSPDDHVSQPSHQLVRSDSHHDLAQPQPVKHTFHLSLEKDDVTTKILPIPRPAFTTPQFNLSDYFPKLTPGFKSNTILDAISPFDGAAISKVHRIFVQSPGHLLVEGQMFEMCKS